MISSERQREALIHFFHSGTRFEFSKNQFIVAPDEDLDGVYYIESGIVKSYDITKYNEENLLIVRHQGELIGLTWAITGDAKHIINMALTPATLWFVQRDQFLAYIQANPEVALPILDTITTMYKLHSERIMTLEYRTVRERLASFLLSISRRFGVQNDRGITISAPLRQQDIASSISATRETTSRSLKHFQDQGILAIEPPNITILDEQKLLSIIS